MLLILSARTVEEEIALQFGRLPPSFLPLGDQRLFSYQSDLAFGEPCFMTLPEDYEISDTDLDNLYSAGIQLLRQPQNLRLPEAIGDAIARIRVDEPLRILYGDTLVRMSEAASGKLDSVAIHETNANYPWAFVETSADGSINFSDEPPQRLDNRRVVCGYYNFADVSLLAVACRQPSIVKALNYYNSRRPLSCSGAERWLDFGHLPLYFRSKKDLLVKRVFNELTFQDHLLIKRSKDTRKIRAEAHWFENLPRTLQLHVPRYYGKVDENFQAGYALEYLYVPLLSDLAAFGALPLASWLEILQGCFEFIAKCEKVRPPSGSPEASSEFATQFFQDLIVDKTLSRLTDFFEQSGFSPQDRICLNGVKYAPLQTVVESLISMIPPTTTDNICFWHGDLFFGNMFYEFTSQRILCVDPRGQLASGQLCLWGDLRYDIAKLAHSIIGGYDKIVLGRSHLEVSKNDPLDWQFSIDAAAEMTRIEDVFFAYIKNEFSVEDGEILALTALLFLSMLPLHHESPERQLHLLAAGLLLAKRAEIAK